MVAIDSDSDGTGEDLFGRVDPSGGDNPGSSASTPASRPRARRAPRTAINAASVDPGVAAEFSVRDMFTDLMPASPADDVVTELASLQAPLPDGGLPEVLCTLSIPEDEDSPQFEAGPATTVTDEQLEQELREWSPTEAESAAFLWRLQVAVLEENLAFLMSVDVKPRVTREKAWVLQWVYTEDRVGSRDFTQHPLSFHNCARTCGFNDPDVLRGALLQVPLIRDLLTALHLYLPRELPPLRRVVNYADIVGMDRAQLVSQVYQFPGM